MGFQAKPRSLRNADPAGRVDVALLRAGEHLARRLGAGHVWDSGLGDVAEVLVENMGLPQKQFTAVDVARLVGVLPPEKK